MNAAEVEALGDLINAQSEAQVIFNNFWNSQMLSEIISNK